MSMGKLYLYLFTRPLGHEKLPFRALFLVKIYPQYADTIRYDTRCYFNVRSKADISQLNLPHGDKNWIVRVFLNTTT